MSASTSEPDHAPASAPPADLYCASNFDPELSVGLLMRRVLQSIVQQVDRRLSVHDMTHAQWVPLYRLMWSECSTLAALARELQTDAGALTRAIDRLQAKGLVQRERSTTDRRVVQLVLTDAGRALAGLVPEVLSEVLNAHLAGFSPAEWQTLLGMLQRMQRNGEALRELGLAGEAIEPDLESGDPSA
jgi:DNA-binding MarR family transcriptional regulator